MRKEILVTIDDSPGPASGALLEELERLGIRAVLFCIGAQLENDQETAVRAVRAGHLLGNHSYGHAWYSTLSVAEIIADIDRADQLIEEVYAAAGVPRPLKVFRYPFGDKGVGNSRLRMPFRHLSRRFRAVQQHLGVRGYAPLRMDGLAMHAPLSWCRGDVDWSWTCDLKEFDGRDFGFISKDVARIVQRTGREILLMHDHQATIGVVCRTLALILEHGAAFVDP